MGTQRVGPVPEAALSARAQQSQRPEVVARRWEALHVSLALLALLGIFFWRPILQGGKLLPADIIYTDPVYLNHAPEGFVKPHNALLYDQAYQFYPWRVYTTQAVRQGSLPFWNPYVYCGTPLLAEDQPAVFYPFNLLTYALAPSDAVLFTAIARLFIAGLATYWFVRSIGGGRFGAWIGSLTFMFSGFMIVWLGHPHTNVAAWLPALFLTTEWLSQQRNAHNVAWVALVIAAQLTGGHTETALYTLTAGGLYFVFRLLSAREPERRWRHVSLGLLSFAAAALLGVALASVHLFPFLEWLQNSAELSFRVGAENLRSSRVGVRYWLGGLLPAFLPNVFNNPTWPGEYQSFFPSLNFVEQTLYVGSIGLALAVTGALARRKSRMTWFLSALGLLALGAALRWPGFDGINHLPLFNIAAYGRLRVAFTFCTSILAGLGAQEIFKRTDVPGRRSPALLTAVVSLAGFALVAALIFLIAPRTLLEQYAATGGTEATRLSRDLVLQAFRLSNVRMYWPVLVALTGLLVCALYLRRAMGRRAAQVALLLLVVVDLFALGMDYHTTLPQEQVYPDTPALQYVKRDSDLFRVVGTNIDLMPNTVMVHGLYDIRGLDFPISRYAELCQAMGGQDWLGYGILFTERLEPKLLSLMNVKYVLTTSRLGPKVLADMQLVETDRDVKVYENQACLPRAFIVHRAYVAQDAQEALSTLTSPDFRVGEEIVLEKSPPPAFVTTDGSREDARVVQYSPNRVVVQANPLSSAFLFLSDTYYPGWKAYVDGARTEIYQADYAFRAVFLDAGAHTVEFVYESEFFRAAVPLCLLALGCIVILVLWRNPISARERSTETPERRSSVTGPDEDSRGH